jgi:hypothetical protein
VDRDRGKPRNYNINTSDKTGAGEKEKLITCTVHMILIIHVPPSGGVALTV